MVFTSMFKTKAILVLPGCFILKELGHTSPPPEVCSMGYPLKLGGIPQECFTGSSCFRPEASFWPPPEACVCFPTAMPGPPIESTWQHSGGRCASKALTVFMVPAASLASNEVSSSFVWDFLGARAHFFKVVKG